VLLADVSELSIGSIFIGRWMKKDEEFFIHLPMKMAPIESSETSANNTQTPGTYSKESKPVFFFASNGRVHITRPG
jgi:hypothetical protein